MLCFRNTAMYFLELISKESGPRNNLKVKTRYFKKIPWVTIVPLFKKKAVLLFFKVFPNRYSHNIVS